MPYTRQPIPDGLDKSLWARWVALQEVIAGNAELEEELAKYGSVLNIASVLGARVQALIDVLFPFDSGLPAQEARLRIDEAVQKGAAEFLTANKSTVIKTVLAQGAQLPPSLLDKMAAQQGLGPNGKGLYRG